MAKGRKPAAGEKTGHRKPADETEVLAARVAPVEDGLATRQPPDDLPPVATEAWSVCISEMAANRHVRESDLLLLRSYVEAVEVHEEAWASILKHGAMMAVYATDMMTGELVLDSKGDPITVGLKPNPAVKMRDGAANQMRYYSDILGLNPLARIRQNLAEIAGTSMMLDIRDKLISDMTRT